MDDEQNLEEKNNETTSINGVKDVDSAKDEQQNLDEEHTETTSVNDAKDVDSAKNEQQNLDEEHTETTSVDDAKDEQQNLDEEHTDSTFIVDVKDVDSAKDKQQNLDEEHTDTTSIDDVKDKQQNLDEEHTDSTFIVDVKDVDSAKDKQQNEEHTDTTSINDVKDVDSAKDEQQNVEQKHTEKTSTTEGKNVDSAMDEQQNLEQQHTETTSPNAVKNVDSDTDILPNWLIYSSNYKSPRTSIGSCEDEEELDKLLDMNRCKWPTLEKTAPSVDYINIVPPLHLLSDGTLVTTTDAESTTVQSARKTVYPSTSGSKTATGELKAAKRKRKTATREPKTDTCNPKTAARKKKIKLAKILRQKNLDNSVPTEKSTVQEHRKLTPNDLAERRAMLRKYALKRNSKTAKTPAVAKVRHWYRRYLRYKLNILRKQERFCDMIIQVPGQRFKVHTIIMAMGNTVFVKYLSGKKKTKQFSKDDNDYVIVNLPEISGEIFSILLNFMYTRSFVGLSQLTVSQLRKLHEAATLIGVREVNLFGKAFSRQIISTRNFVELWDVADDLCNKELQSALVTFIIKRLSSLWMTDELQTLTEPRFKRLLAVAFKKADLQDYALRALLGWVKQNIPVRRSSFPLLVSYIRLSNVSESYVSQLLETDSFVQENRRFCRMLERTLKERHKCLLLPVNRLTNASKGVETGAKPKIPSRHSSKKSTHGTYSALARKVLTQSITCMKATGKPKTTTSVSRAVSSTNQQSKNVRTSKSESFSLKLSNSQTNLTPREVQPKIKSNRQLDSSNTKCKKMSPLSMLSMPSSVKLSPIPMLPIPSPIEVLPILSPVEPLPIPAFPIPLPVEVSPIPTLPITSPVKVSPIPKLRTTSPVKMSPIPKLPIASPVKVSPIPKLPITTPGKGSPIPTSPIASSGKMSPIPTSPIASPGKMSPIPISPIASPGKRSPIPTSPIASPGKMSPISTSPSTSRVKVSPIPTSPITSPVKVSPTSLPEKLTPQKDVLIVGKDIISRDIILVVYSTSKGTWVEIENIGPWVEENQTALTTKTRVFLIGGEDESRKHKLATVHMYNLKKKSSTRLQDLHIPRTSPIVFVWKNTLYACGGVGRFSKALSQVESVDLSNEKASWKIMAQMKTRRDERASSCVLNKLVYVVGGGTNKCECFVCDKKYWLELPSLPEDFNDLTPFIVAVEDKIVVFNYFRPVRMFILDNEHKTWKVQSFRGQPPEWVISITCVNKRIYVMEKSHKLYSFDLVKRRWKFELKIMKNHFQPMIITPWDGQI